MGLLGKFGMVGDVTKDILMIPRVLLSTLALWPDMFDIRTIWYSLLLYLVSILAQAGQLVFLINNFSDISKMASAVSTLSPFIQSNIKIPVFYFHSGKLRELLFLVRNRFWSSDLMGVELGVSLKHSAKMVAAAILIVYTTGVIYVISYLSAPALMGTGELPFLSSYPFNWRESPAYELVYFFQCYTYVAFVMQGVLGHDNIFYVIVTNCVAQFKLLREAFSKIGSADIDEINKRLDRYYDREDEDESLSGNSKLLYRCVKHHRLLIKVCNDTERIFTASIAAQLAATLSALCVSSYLITLKNLNFQQLTHLFSYVTVHLSQFFLFCIAGTELTYEASTLSTYLFNSRWYDNDVPKDVKKAIPFVMQRSQIPQKFTAVSMVDLNYSTYLKVLQLSFSFYTLLSTMTENK